MKTHRRVIIIMVAMVFAIICYNELSAQKTVIGYNMLSLSFAGYAGDGTRFADDLTDEVILGLEAEGFYDISGLNYKNKTRAGFHFNFFLEHQVSPRFHIHPELSYTLKGNRFVTNDIINAHYFDYYYGYNDYISFNYKQVMGLRRNYIDAPVLLVYKFKETGKYTKHNPFIIGGPYASALVISKTKYKVTIDGESDQDEEYDSMSKRFDYGACFGFGIDLNESEPTFIRLEFRYMRGFTNTFKEESSSGYILMNQFITFNLAIMFRS